MRKHTVKQKLTQSIIFLILLVMAVSFLYPIFFMGINSFKTKSEYRKGPFALPQSLDVNNYYLLIRNFKILDAFLNTFIIAICSVLVSVLLAVFASYAFAKLRFKGRTFVYLFIISTMFIPAQVTMIPLYYMMSNIHLNNTLISVIIAYVATSLPGTILLMTTSFSGISDEMIEAATIDGAGYFKIVRKVVVPMGMAVIAINIIFNFLGASNDLFTPMILIQKMEKRTVMVALASLMNARGGDPAYQLAGLTFSALPPLLVYIVFSRFIVKGITVGSIK
ncbi:MAG: carbohydrate ABC transporter permease [Eubacteriales bacterium]|nr:carbohydrate ABC transporter permease [Eubacteriales bacterium]